MTHPPGRLVLIGTPPSPPRVALLSLLLLVLAHAAVLEANAVRVSVKIPEHLKNFEDVEQPDGASKGGLMSKLRELHEELFGTDLTANINGTCDSDIHLLWNVQVGSSVVATPTVVDLDSDGRKEILVPTATHYLEALDGATGEDARGFPFVHPRLASLGSVVEVDRNRDGTGEWLIPTFDGHLIYIDNSGHGKPGWTVKLPPLLMKKNWTDWEKFSTAKDFDKADIAEHEAVLQERRKRIAREDPKHFDISGEKHSTVQRMRGGGLENAMHQPQPPLRRNAAMRFGDHDGMRRPQPLPPTIPPRADPVTAPPQQPQPSVAPAGRKLLQEPVAATGENDSPEYAPGMGFDDYYGLEDGMLDEEGMYGHEYYDEDDEKYGELAEEHVEIGTDGWLSPEARQSMDLIYHPEMFAAAGANVAHDEDLFAPLPGYAAPPPPKGDELLVDAHILAAPVVVDLDLDGGLDAVIPVSYFFDLEFYAKRENADALPQDIDPLRYAAAGLVVVDLETGAVKWSRQLHTSHRLARHVAFAISTPIVLNADQDGTLDIYVTTADGEIVAFDARGNPKPGYPIHIGPTQSGCMVQDINGDGKLDICTGDLKGVVACFNIRTGELLWEFATDHGSVSETPMAGDVNGDGYLDIAFGTSGGGIWALDGRTGRPLPHFPVAAQGPVLAPVLLVNLNNTSPPASPASALGLHVVVPAKDGILYVVSGRTGCVQMLDIGEESYSMVLTDDVSGNGRMDLVVSTLSGSVMVFETSVPFHPLKQWPARFKSVNTLTASEGHLGIYIEPESRSSRDVRGDFFRLLITIRDDRVGRHQVFSPRYYVTITIGKRLLVLSRLYFEARTYAETIPTPLERVYGPVIVTMRTQDLLSYEDRVAMSFNMHFLETIKYVFLIPTVALLAALAFVRKKHEVKPLEIQRGRYRGEDFYYYS